MDEVIAAANRFGHDLPRDVALKQIAGTRTMGPYKPSTLLDFEAGDRSQSMQLGRTAVGAQVAGVNMPKVKQFHAVLDLLNDARE